MDPQPELFLYLRLPDSIAQLVEQQTLNLWVLSSSLSGVTKIQPFSITL